MCEQAEAGGKRLLGKATVFSVSVGPERSHLPKPEGMQQAQQPQLQVFMDTVVVTYQETSPCFQSKAADRMFSGELPDKAHDQTA